jgi:hypothetical protein
MIIIIKGHAGEREETACLAQTGRRVTMRGGPPSVLVLQASRIHIRGDGGTRERGACGGQ